MMVQLAEINIIRFEFIIIRFQFIIILSRLLVEEYEDFILQLYFFIQFIKFHLLVGELFQLFFFNRVVHESIYFLLKEK